MDFSILNVRDREDSNEVDEYLCKSKYFYFISIMWACPKGLFLCRRDDCGIPQRKVGAIGEDACNSAAGDAVFFSRSC